MFLWNSKGLENTLGSSLIVCVAAEYLLFLDSRAMPSQGFRAQAVTDRANITIDFIILTLSELGN